MIQVEAVFMIQLQSIRLADAEHPDAYPFNILMAYPGATLLDIDSAPSRKANLDELGHVSLTRAFLGNPSAFLRHL
jgi:hypothetical protein